MTIFIQVNLNYILKQKALLLVLNGLTVLTLSSQLEIILYKHFKMFKKEL